MTEQERIICEIITKSKAIATIPEIAKLIIKAFPKILAKKVWEGNKNKMIRDTWAYCRWDKESEDTNIEIFIREVKS